MQYRDDTKEWPIEAITFNRRQMAFYKAYEENPNAPAVVGTLDRGLRSVRMLSSHCPDYLVRDLVRLHNLSHGGSGLHMFDLIDSALELEQAWQAKCAITGVTAANPTAYQKLYEEFMFANSDKFATYKSFESTKSFAHRLKDFGIMKSWRSWCQSHLDFLDSSVSIQSMIATCHAMVNTVLSNTNRFYSKSTVGRVLFEALKLAVGVSVCSNHKETKVTNKSSKTNTDTSNI